MVTMSNHPAQEFRYATARTLNLRLTRNEIAQPRLGGSRIACRLPNLPARIGEQSLATGHGATLGELFRWPRSASISPRPARCSSSGRVPTRIGRLMPIWCAVDLEWLWAALIGVGGSAVGGLVGGWYALRAGHAQWQRDREDARTDRSHQAAMSIAGAVGEMEQAIGTWQANPTDQAEIAALLNTFNAFSRGVAIESLALTDDELRSRVRAHQTFVGVLGKLAQQGGTAGPPLAGQVRRHADVVLDAIAAHVHGQPLPPYEPFLLDNAGALMQWTPVPTPVPQGAGQVEPRSQRRFERLRKRWPKKR